MSDSYKKIDEFVIQEGEPYSTHALNWIDDNNRDLYRRGSHLGLRGHHSPHRGQSDYQGHRPLTSVREPATVVMIPWLVERGLNRFRIRMEVRVGIGGDSDPGDIDNLSALSLRTSWDLGERGGQQIDLKPAPDPSGDWAWQVVEYDFVLDDLPITGFDMLRFSFSSGKPAEAGDFIVDELDQEIPGNGLIDWSDLAPVMRHEMIWSEDPLYDIMAPTDSPEPNSDEITYSASLDGGNQRKVGEITNHAGRAGNNRVMYVWPVSDSFRSDQSRSAAKFYAMYLQIRGIEIQAEYDEDLL